MKLKIILLTLSFLILALSLTGGYFYYQNAKSYAVQENHNLIDSHVAKMTADLNAIINAKKSAVSRLAAKETLRQALQDPSPATTRAANTVLAESSHAFPDSVFYLIDVNGNTLASSNLKEPDSFVGHNYGFRPYFQEAIQGRPALFLGIGVTSKKPGIYLAYPVTEKNTAQIIGVAVGKFSINEAIEKVSAQPFQLQHGMFFLTGPYSIILSSNHQELTGKFLWEPLPRRGKKLPPPSSLAQGHGPGQG
jgi:C4-dicarboxylate-specific signal transduction histidine kinase